MTRRWTLPAELVDTAFPFHLVLDEELRVTEAGSSVQQLHGEGLIGHVLADLFDVTTPKVPTGFDAFARHSRSLFLLRSRFREGLVLRGQMLFDAGAHRLVFVGSPWVTETSTFVSLGLTLDDFAVSDAVVDYVLLLQHQSTSLMQARELAEQLRDTAQQLTHQAFHDTLTGLPNRSQLLAQLQCALDTSVERGAETQLAVLMMDLDGFKAVNDSFGHSAGDAVLEVVGKRLQSVGRAEDIVARFGGDEFAMVIGASRSQPGAPPPVVEAIAERVLASIAEPISLPPNWGGVIVPLSVSIGIAHATGNESADDLLRNADLAMYAAKAEASRVTSRSLLRCTPRR